MEDDASFQSTLERARRGDPRAMTVLYAQYNRMLVRYLRAKVSGYGEDLAQETWLAVAPKLCHFSGDERAFRMLLLTEGRRQASEFRRTSQLERVRSVSPRTLTGLRPDPVGDEPVADAAVAQLLAGLRPLHAEILLLRVVGGLTAEEAGALLGKSPGMIRVTQHRVLKQLARRLSTEPVAP